jgi:eukaryotic translation initiation factor 2C
MVKERLKVWMDNNPTKRPSKSHGFFFRDGISESQFKAFKDDEIRQINEAYQQVKDEDEKAKKTAKANCDSARDLKLTFVVVGKRHHTRFYAREESQTYQSTVKSVQILNGNVIPGLLVEDIVTNPLPYNVFPQSHKAIKGTARSAHYYVLLDEMKLGSDELPNLAMLLCYAYGRSTTGVSYVG